MAFLSFIVGVILSNVSVVWYRTVYIGLCGVEFPCEYEQNIAIVIELSKSLIDIGVMILFYYSFELGKGYPKIGIPSVIMFSFGILIGGMQFLLYHIELGAWWELLMWILFSAMISVIICLWVGRINKKCASSFNEAINTN